MWKLSTTANILSVWFEKTEPPFFSLFSKASISSVSAISEEMQDELTVKEVRDWCRNEELNLTFYKQRHNSMVTVQALKNRTQNPRPQMSRCLPTADGTDASEGTDLLL